MGAVAAEVPEGAPRTPPSGTGSSSNHHLSQTQKFYRAMYKEGGRQQLAQAIHTHWQLRDNQNKAYEDVEQPKDVPKGQLNTAADFAEPH